MLCTMLILGTCMLAVPVYDMVVPAYSTVMSAHVCLIIFSYLLKSALLLQYSYRIALYFRGFHGYRPKHESYSL